MKLQGVVKLLLLICFKLFTCCSTNQTMSELEEQCAVIKFFAKTGDMPMQCWTKLKEGFGDRSHTQNSEAMVQKIQQWSDIGQRQGSPRKTQICEDPCKHPEGPGSSPG